jgi:hypothetical protein
MEASPSGVGASSRPLQTNPRGPAQRAPVVDTSVDGDTPKSKEGASDRHTQLSHACKKQMNRRSRSRSVTKHVEHLSGLHVWVEIP